MFLLFSTANAALVENHLSALVLSLHVGDQYPFRPRHVFIPPLTEGFLPIIEHYDTHFFEIGISDADYATVHFCKGKKNVLQEKATLRTCAMKFLRTSIDLNKYDFIVMTDNENYYLDAVMLTQRMQYIQARPLQYKQGWGNFNQGRFAITTNYLRTVISAVNDLDEDLEDDLKHKKSNTATSQLAPLTIDPSVIIPGTSYLTPLLDRSEHTRRKARNHVLYTNGVTFHVGHHVLESR